MASVALRFVPPRAENLTKLRIFESTTKEGTFTVIEEITGVGDYPDYIDNYTTDEAGALDNWFAIQWVDDKGAVSELSVPVQGNTENLVSTVSDRVLQRDAALDEVVVIQVSEWVVGKTKNTEEPYDPLLTATLNELEGMTLLALARSYLSLAGSTTSEDTYTAGLVSQKVSSGSLQTVQGVVKWLIDEANKLLGWNWTVVMLLEDIDPVGIGTVSTINFDQSRLALTINFE